MVSAAHRLRIDAEHRGNLRRVEISVVEQPQHQGLSLRQKSRRNLHLFRRFGLDLVELLRNGLQRQSLSLVPAEIVDRRATRYDSEPRPQARALRIELPQ